MGHFHEYVQLSLLPVIGPYFQLGAGSVIAGLLEIEAIVPVWILRERPVAK